MSAPLATIVGADRPFGAQIEAALRRAGFGMGDERGAAPYAAAVVNRPVTATDIRFDAVTDEDVDVAIQDQVIDVVDAVRLLLPRLSEGSRIVLVGSRGFLGAWGGVHLMMASAALAGMMRSMALEFAGRGISVNLVAAGFVGTSWDTLDARRQVANSVRLLAEADIGLSGQTIIVDGGRSLRMSESRFPRSGTP